MKRADVRVTVGGQELRDWESYELTSSMREASSTCSLTAGHDKDRKDALAPGAKVQVTIDRRPVFAGFVTTRSLRGHRVEIGCHDILWPLLRGSAPLSRIASQTIESFAELLTGLPVVFSNAANRDLYRRRGRKTGKEPPVLNARAAPIKIPPGDTKWQVLSEMLRRASLLAWAQGDGKAIVLAKPNFSQEPRYSFSLDPAGKSTCSDIGVEETIEAGYRAVTVVGTSRVSPESSQSSGKSLRRGATASDPTYPLDIQATAIEEVRSIDDAQSIADAHLADGVSERLKCTVQAFGNSLAGRIYAIDTTAQVSDKRNGFAETMYITSVTLSGNRATETATLELVPLGTRIVIP